MSARLLLIPLVLAVGCERLSGTSGKVPAPSYGKAPESVSPGGNGSVIPVDPEEAKRRAAEETRLADLRGEIALLPAEDRAWLKAMDERMKERPAKPLPTDDRARANKLVKYLNAATALDFMVAVGDSYGAERLANLLKLNRSDSLAMRATFADKTEVDRKALATAIERAANGLRHLTDADRALLKQHDYGPFLKNLAD
jgi:hypothetical protein